MTYLTTCTAIQAYIMSLVKYFNEHIATMFYSQC